MSRELVRLAAPAGVDVLVAGGLTPANVADAVRVTGCAGVDAHTGLEDASGAKAPELVRAFVQAARGAARP